MVMKKMEVKKKEGCLNIKEVQPCYAWRWLAPYSITIPEHLSTSTDMESLSGTCSLYDGSASKTVCYDGSTATYCPLGQADKKIASPAQKNQQGHPVRTAMDETPSKDLPVLSGNMFLGEGQ